MNIQAARSFLLVEMFLRGAGASLASFRYFSRRQPEAAMKSHLCTLLGFEDDVPIAYGHLDQEDRTTWLGLCVADRCRGQGLGRQMMTELVDRADRSGLGEIWLGVDEDNLPARGLYEKFDFTPCSRPGPTAAPLGVVFMRRTRGGGKLETLGSLIDKLFTVDQKMFLNQELLYEVRRMDFAQFKDKYLASEGGGLILWETLKKVCDLNLQRNQLIEEIDEKTLEIARAAHSGDETVLCQLVKRQHKTY